MILHKAIRKYGKENFIITELDRSNDKNYCLNILENYYITKYNSTNKNIGYNSRFGGECGNFTDETKKKLSISAKKRYLNKNYVHPCKNKTYEEIYGKEESLIIRHKISKNHKNVNGENNPMSKTNITDYMSIEKYNAWKKSCLGENSKMSKTFYIIDPNTKKIIYSNKGINNFSKMLGLKSSSTLKYFAKNNKKIHTKNKTIYDGYIITYIKP